jgi:hypothetical protein
MTKEDFIKEEYTLLKIMFTNMENTIRMTNNSNTYFELDANALFSLAEKLGIVNLYCNW